MSGEERAVSLQRRLEAATEKLAVLGTTTAIGLELAARGIKARRDCPTACVLAEYFFRELAFTERDFVEVDGAEGDPLWFVHVADFSEDARLILPKHVGDMAEQFDAGEWPQLEEATA